MQPVNINKQHQLITTQLLLAVKHNVTAAAASTALTNVREVPRDSERSLATTQPSSVQCMTTAARDDATSCNHRQPNTHNIMTHKSHRIHISTEHRSLHIFKEKLKTFLFITVYYQCAFAALANLHGINCFIILSFSALTLLGGHQVWYSRV